MGKLTSTTTLQQWLQLKRLFNRLEFDGLQDNIIFGSGYCFGSRMHFLGTIISALPVCVLVFLYLLTCVAIVFIQLRTTNKALKVSKYRKARAQT